MQRDCLKIYKLIYMPVDPGIKSTPLNQEAISIVQQPIIYKSQAISSQW